MQQETLDAPQHLHALRRANCVRLGRAERKREGAVIRDGVEAAVWIRSLREDDSCSTLKLTEALGALWRWGPTRARKALHTCDIPEGKTIGAMTDRQVRVICSFMERGAVPMSLEGLARREHPFERALSVA